MSDRLDSQLVSIGVKLSQRELDVERATEMLSAPEILNEVDGSNVQQLIRASLMTSQMDSGSAMLAEVGVLVTMLRPELEIDFGLSVGVANAQSCALFAMHSVMFQQGNIDACLSILRMMIPSLKRANDRKGLLETLCCLGLLHEEIGDKANAAGAFNAAIALLDEPEIAEALEDNSAMDMVRADNRNVFSFPTLTLLDAPSSHDIGSALRERLARVQASSES